MQRNICPKKEDSTLYTEQDLNDIKAQQKKRWLVLGIPGALLLIGLIISLVVRIEWLTTLLTVLFGALLIAGYDLFIRPLHRYQKFLQEALHGRVRETECLYQSITPDAEPVDGVLCRTVTVIDHDHDDNEKPYERIFYFDVLKPFPDLTPGQKLHVVFHDRAVVSLEAI